jgi:CRP-like cAMP-binding protein
MTENRGALFSAIKSALSPYFRSARYFRSETLWREGDTKGMLVSLVEGRVRIYRLMPDGKAVTMYIMRRGDVFGFLPLIDGGPYPVSAEAIEDVNAMVITHAQFLEALNDDPRAALPLLRFLSGHLRTAFDLIMRLSSRDALSRVASALCGLLEEQEALARGEIELPVSSREYAALLGLTPESFSRKITELVEMDVLERAGINRFRIIDYEKLSSIAVPGMFL